MSIAVYIPPEMEVVDFGDAPELEVIDFGDAPTFDVPDLTPAPEFQPEYSDVELHAISEPCPIAATHMPGGFTMRDYQESSIRSIFHDLATYKATLLVLATGCGKTVVFTRAAKIEVELRKGRVLILAHSDELLDQAADKLKKSTGLYAAKEKADNHASLYDDIVVGSVQTLGRQARLNNWPEDHFTLIIIDEAHRSLAKSYMNVIEHFKTAKLLGVTATADRGDQKSLGKLYESIAFEYGILEACRDGYLVPPIAKTLPLKIDLTKLKPTKGRTGDFKATDVADTIEPFIYEIAGELKKINDADPRITMIFLPSVDLAEMMTDALRGHGIEADFVCGDRARCPDRSDRLARFASGETKFMSNAMLLTEGYDNPLVSRIVPLRPTKLRALYCQIVGRGTRILPGTIDHLNGSEYRDARLQAIKASAKPDLEIIDFLWLTEKLDLAKPAHLVSGNPEVVKRIQDAIDSSDEDTDLMESEAEARDLLKSLESEVSRNSKKAGKTFDPLAKAINLADDDLRDYQPQSQWDAQKPTDEQTKILIKHGLDPERVHYRGLASKWIQKVITRKQMGLCSLKQMTMLKKMGVSNPSNYTSKEAGAAMGKKFNRWKKKTK